MASFTVEHEAKASKEDTFKKVKKFFEESESLKKLDDSLEYSFDESQYTGKVKGSKFDCSLKVTGSNPAKVHITVNLSFFLTPFKGKIQETLQSKISQVLG
jgi:hypothetical protein